MRTLAESELDPIMSRKAHLICRGRHVRPSAIALVAVLPASRRCALNDGLDARLAKRLLLRRFVYPSDLNSREVGSGKLLGTSVQLSADWKSEIFGKRGWVIVGPMEIFRRTDQASDRCGGSG